jgi:hypothetical protein
MGKKKGLSCKHEKKRLSASSHLPLECDHKNENGMYVDPTRIRFQHSRIRPFFSGCGRSLTVTLEEIRNGTMQVSDLPPIQVIVGPNNCAGIDSDEKTNEPWYFSLNNRRLWVLKRLREDGLLEPYDNKVFVRVRMPKSQQEQARYCLGNCALEAKIVPEKSSNKNKGSSKTKNSKLMDDEDSSMDEELKAKSCRHQQSQEVVRSSNSIATSQDDESDSDDHTIDNVPSNRFSALLLS